MSMNAFSRRELMARLGWATSAAVVATAAPSIARVASARIEPAASASRTRSLRIAHLTDTHVQPERGADRGLASCLHHVQAQPDQPDLILTGGDHVMDAMAKNKPRTQLQWDIWKRVIASDCALPIEPCIGNHDIWGWTKAKSEATGEEPNYGKKWAMDELGLAQAYRSFDRGGWHFIVLDSVYPFQDKYQARLDEKQFAWLEADLAAADAKRPILVLSHIPILSVAAFFGKDSKQTEELRIGGGTVHLDFRRIHALFKKHPNVKVALSGHLHLVDHIDYSGVTYLCNGAVSGAWWRGTHMNECDAGYAMLNLYDDGSVEREYVNYGWKYEADATTQPVAQARPVPI